jgi:lipopolysaccharide/colanic/teichoic acid biosynthesis glycosyltransferase
MGNGAAKRAYDLFFATMGLIILSPGFLAIALLTKLCDGGPVFFRQLRVGLNGRLFWIWKFRTMIVGADKMGVQVTKDGDPRITRIGRLLRKSKLDELPQLWNVFRGEMSLVGPRPEVPQYVSRYTAAQREILNLKPGITDLATLEFCNEEEILRSASNVEDFYMTYCVPQKIELNRLYAKQSSIWADTLLICRTLFFWTRHRKQSSAPPAEFQPIGTSEIAK